jgi:hypothetical protein
MRTTALKWCSYRVSASWSFATRAWTLANLTDKGDIDEERGRVDRSQESGYSEHNR